MRFSARLARGTLCVLALSACQGGARGELESRGATAVEFRELNESKQYFSGVAERKRSVIRDQSAWDALWRQASADHLPARPTPSVDFSREMVIVAAMGTKSSGGYSIHIDSVSERNHRLHVAVREVSPGKDCMTTMALTAPAIAVVVPRRDGDVVFVESSTTQDCQ
jgi:hypothetical protein